VFYQIKVRFLKNRKGNLLWRYWRAWRGDHVGAYKDLPEYIRKYAPGKSFVDIGCMWGVNGEYAFIAEEAGAIAVKGVDIFGPTPEFETKKREYSSSMEFILGDASHPDTIAKVGLTDIVFCTGVLYHHPSPFDLLVALRRMCAEKLILRTSTIPEIHGLPNAAVYYPMIKPKERKLWNLSELGVSHQAGISDDFNPEEGYGNWFWGLTPSCVTSLLKTAGFRIEHRVSEAFSQTFICSPIDAPFVYRLPDDDEARRIARAISSAGTAQPA